MMDNNKINSKILIIPIGPPGCGKTSLGLFIKDYFSGSGKIKEEEREKEKERDKCFKVFYTNRDDEYKRVRNEGNGSRKTRRILYDCLMDFYQSVNDYEDDCIIYG